ncbi:hypothetical protein [Desulfurobacterium atlanticum]|uniref:DUF948 domain-containing protein n=1 Tax=Desulfurobacterium atlanticum TaxID=240169 RepID=A0A238ZSV8_9BACT|nr:hypothetical protein [Desulfurobacterium atlanticum]SNR85844.1 hypothetical protein SAMN06265340_11116 [Desulfurobacterium atlanticum]
MSVETVSLAVIATCMVIITVSIVVLTIVAYSILKKLGELIDKTETEVTSTFRELKEVVNSFTDTLRGFATVARFVTGRKKR